MSRLEPNRRRAATCALVLAAALAVAASNAAGAAGDDDDLSDKQVEALAEEYLALDGRTDAGRQRQLAILAELDGQPALDARDAKRWRKTFLELAADGPELEKRSGRKWFWEEEERGLYIVGGKTKSPKGLFIGMHGGGVGEGDAANSAAAFGSAASKFKWVGIFPEVLEKTEHGWTDSGTEEFVVDLIECVLRTWKVDPDRVYLGGHSMGGYGTWTLGAHHADSVAGLAPSAGAPTPLLDRGGNQVGVIPGVIPSLRNVRLAIFQSADDPQVPPEANRFAVEELGKARERFGGFDYEYWEVEHNAHDLPPGGARELLEKIADAERDPVPPKVVWQTFLPWKRHFYWLWSEVPDGEALVVAELDREANAIDVTVDGRLADLSLLLDDRLVDLEREVVVRVGGEERWRGVPERTLATLLMTADRCDPGLVFEARVRVLP